MSFLASLALYKTKSAQAAHAAANPKPVKPPYKHPLHDNLLSIRQASLAMSTDTTSTVTNGSSSVGELEEAGHDIPCTFAGLTIMFMIIDELPFECVWRTWLEAASTTAQRAVRIIIHAKYPGRVASDWVRARLCRSFQLKPEWGRCARAACVCGYLSCPAACLAFLILPSSAPPRSPAPPPAPTPQRGAD